MKKLLTITGAVISLVMSACNKPEQPKMQSGDDVHVEDYANQIIEYDDFDISYSSCTKYGAIDPTYDACGNRTNHNGHCSDFVAKRCATDNPNQCECNANGNIVDCNEPSVTVMTNSGPQQLTHLEYHKQYRDEDSPDDTSAHRHKYSVSAQTVGVEVTSCNETTGKNETKTVQAVVRKMCAVDVPKDDVYYKGRKFVSGEECECNIIKDNCGNYVDKNGRAVYKNQSTDGSCLGELGKAVDCKAPKVTKGWDVYGLWHWW